MRRAHRQPAQTFVLAALAMTAMVGAISMVIDAGVYFVIQRELQNAGDAAVLSAAWYEPACDPLWPGCQTANLDPLPPECPNGPPEMRDSANAYPCTAAVNTAKANWGAALSLCQGPNVANGTIPVNIDAYPGQKLTVPQIGTYVVVLSCDAPHWFARILPGVLPSMHISVSSVAAVGWPGTSGQLQGGPAPTPAPSPTPSPRLVARLLNVPHPNP